MVDIIRASTLETLNSINDPSRLPGGSDEPDFFAGAVLGSLGRVVGSRQYWNVARTFAVALVSFGIWPVIRMGRNIRDYTIIEQQQLWHLAEWLRMTTGRREATELRDLTLELRPRPVLRWMPVVLVAAVLLVLYRILPSGDLFNGLMECTYGFRRTVNTVLPAGEARMAFAAWSIGLTLAYAAHWMQARLHASDVARVVEKFNEIAVAEAVAPVKFQPPGNGLRALWLFAAFWMVMFGAVWGLPLMLAGALHKRYITESSHRLRKELAHRVRAMLLRRRPTMAVPRPVRLVRECGNDRCRAPLPETARFCPRCGLAAMSLTTSVA